MRIAKFIILSGIVTVIVVIVSLITGEFYPWLFIVGGIIAFLLAISGGHSK